MARVGAESKAIFRTDRFLNNESISLNQLWSELIITELERLGVTTFCLASGSRCTPLSDCLSTRPWLSVVTHFDERALGFMALGLAQNRERPIVIITTSGSAVANLLPAIIEASQQGLPLICITADRPFECQDCRSNQTISQDGIFGSYVNYSRSLPAPTVDIRPEVVLSTIDYLFSFSLFNGNGPVHLNCSFREPLLTDSCIVNQSYFSAIQSWMISTDVYSLYFNDNTLPDHLISKLIIAKKGVIVIGDILEQELLDRVLLFAKQYQWPVLVNPLGGGDIKLMGAIGILWGIKVTFITLYLSFIIGGIFSLILFITKQKKAKDYMSFGPSIGIASIIALFWGELLWNHFVGPYI
ncbi:2-succinyl-5-enolpyruvyl-6-hydroxy-3-cyclohexene-1-carboxylic-acid synthase [Candidatus Marinamargulisbacteria bacterium SCGC AG-410-N11]|nr:2-succinyl-5-enolpyruvyl-6-hydroxy-3-cyclohexene-1-carboxylic-acid synthase [Candidatus Marinamargulisbacteria bacterium SCGC AG-410-N11]